MSWSWGFLSVYNLHQVLLRDVILQNELGRFPYICMLWRIFVVLSSEKTIDIPEWEPKLVSQRYTPASKIQNISIQAQMSFPEMMETLGSHE